MRRILTIAIAMLSALGCKPRQAADDSSAKNFFENSRRREATNVEKARVVRLPMGCTGFYVENSQRKTVVATARHCVDYNATDWCKKLGEMTDAVSGTKGTCKAIVAGDGLHDIFLFESTLPLPNSMKTFRLAGFAPPARTRLTMTGYPADKYATGGVMTSENCWILRDLVDSPHKESADGAKGALDKSYTHNCSTYGGNSGGPMFIESTDIVVGQPFTYSPENYGNRAYTEEAWGAHMVEFVKTFRTQVDAAGIAVVETLPGSLAAGNYFAAGRYRSPGWDGCEAALVPHYLTTAALHRVYVSMTGTCEGNFTFSCENGTCKPQEGDGKSTIKPLNDTSFEYFDGTNKVTFSR